MTVPLFFKEGFGEIISLSNPPRSPFKKGEPMEHTLPGNGFPGRKNLRLGGDQVFGPADQSFRNQSNGPGSVHARRHHQQHADCQHSGI